MSWAAKLKLYNQKHLPTQSGGEGECNDANKECSRYVCLNIEDKEKRDEELFEEEYTKLKGQADEQKYALIPKFYSKVTQHM